MQALFALIAVIPIRDMPRTACTIALLAVVPALLSGCLIGILVADPPNTPNTKSGAALARLPVFYEIRYEPDAQDPKALNSDGDYVSLALRRVLVGEDHAIVQEGLPPEKGPYIYYKLDVLPIITESDPGKFSKWLSFFTLSLIPGTYSRTYPVAVSVRVNDPPDSPISASFRYDMTLRAYIWFPFILAADVYGDYIGQGEIGSDLRRGTDDVMRRLAFDTIGLLQKP